MFNFKTRKELKEEIEYLNERNATNISKWNRDRSDLRNVQRELWGMQDRCLDLRVDNQKYIHECEVLRARVEELNHTINELKSIYNRKPEGCEPGRWCEVCAFSIIFDGVSVCNKGNSCSGFISIKEAEEDV